jgi:hypothetical protein
MINREKYFLWDTRRHFSRIPFFYCIKKKGVNGMNTKKDPVQFRPVRTLESKLGTEV